MVKVGTPEHPSLPHDYGLAFDVIAVTEDGEEIVVRGGPGSGHFGHEGRPGEVGGSAPGGGLATQARDAAARLALWYDDFDKFSKDWSIGNFHGTYFHLTNNPDFEIDPNQIPREASSLGGVATEPGLMVTTDVGNWVDTLGDRGYVAVIELDKLEPHVDYVDATRGFGNEIFVKKPAGARVVAVLTTEDAVKFSDRLYERVYPQSKAALRQIWDWAHANLTKRGGPGSGHHGHKGRPGEVGGSAPGEGGGTEQYAGSRARPEDFHSAFEAAFVDNKWSDFVTHHSPDELAGMKALLIAEGGKVGLAVKDHGDGRIEATALFNRGGSKGAGLRLLRQAIEQEGVNYLEAFGPALPKLYGGLGFQTVAQYDFDPNQAPEGWDYNSFDEPDYHIMRLP